MKIENSREMSYSYGVVSQILTETGFENAEKRALIESAKIRILCQLLNIPTRYNASTGEWSISFLEEMDLLVGLGYSTLLS